MVACPAHLSARCDVGFCKSKPFKLANTGSTVRVALARCNGGVYSQALDLADAGSIPVRVTDFIAKWWNGRHTTLRTSRLFTGMGLLGSFLAFPLITYLPVVAGDVQGTGAAGYSALLSSFGAGAVGGAVATAHRGARAGRGRREAEEAGEPGRDRCRMGEESPASQWHVRGSTRPQTRGPGGLLKHTPPPVAAPSGALGRRLRAWPSGGRLPPHSPGS